MLPTIPVIMGLNLDLLNQYPITGIILFSKDIDNPFQLAELTTKIQKLSLDRWKRPVIIAVDQEGGRVSRLKEPFTQFPGMEELGSAPNAVQRVIEYAKVTSFEMRLVGLNTNFAPVLDVRRNHVDEHLRGRTLSDSPVLVGTLGIHIIRMMQSHKVFCVAKHFPGLGKAERDPHKEEVLIKTSFQELEETDFLPFGMVIKAGVTGIMTSHGIYEAIDPLNPATFSKAVNNILRERLGFDGIVVTDDLLMGAITSKLSVEEAGLKAIENGTDLLLISRDADSHLSLLDKLLFQKELTQEGIKSLNKAIARINSLLNLIKENFKYPDLKDVKNYFHLPSYL